MTVEELKKDENKEGGKEKKEGETTTKVEYKPVNRDEMDKNEKKNATGEDPDNALFDAYVKLKFYLNAKGEVTPTGKDNAFTMSKGDVYRILSDKNSTFSNEAMGAGNEKIFQGELFNNLLKTPQGQDMIKKMRHDYGNTNEGERVDASVQKIINKMKEGAPISVQDLMTTRSSFIDGILGARTVYLLKLISTTTTPPVEKIPPPVEKVPEKNWGRFGERLYQPQSLSGFPSLTPVLADVYYFKGGMNIVFKSNKTLDPTPVQPTFTIKDDGDTTKFYLDDKMITSAPKDKVPNFYSNIITGGKNIIRPYFFTENNIKNAVSNYASGNNLGAQQYMMFGNGPGAENLLNSIPPKEEDDHKRDLAQE